MRAQVLRFDLIYTARFARPAYGFVARWVDLFAAIHDRFSPFQSRPEDIRFESTGGQAHEFLVSCSSLPLDMIARYRLGNVEVWTRNQRLTRSDPPVFADIIAAAVGAAKSVIPDLVIENQTITSTGHVRLDVPVSQVLDRVAIASEWARPKGALFAVSAAEGESATVELQPSATFPDANNLWASAVLELSGSIDPLAACMRARRLVDGMLDRVQVELEWSTP